MEFEWTIFLGFTALGILEKTQKLMTELQYEPEQFKGRTIFMSMYNHLLGRWSFLGLGSEKKWYGTYSDKPDGDWDKNCWKSDAQLCRKRSP